MSSVKIAEEAGVSVSTVSQFFNNPDGVSPAAAERNQAAILRFNDRRSERRPDPKTDARNEVRTGVVLLLVITDVVPEICLKRTRFPDFLGCLQRAVSERQLALQIAFTGLDGKIPDDIDRKRCDGVILWGASDTPEFLPRLKKRLRNLPAVWCFRKHNDLERYFDHILSDGFLKLQSLGFRLETLNAVSVNGDSERLNYFSPPVRPLSTSRSTRSPKCPSATCCFGSRRNMRRTVVKSSPARN